MRNIIVEHLKRKMKHKITQVILKILDEEESLLMRQQVANISKVVLADYPHSQLPDTPTLVVYAINSGQSSNCIPPLEVVSTLSSSSFTYMLYISLPQNITSPTSDPKYEEYSESKFPIFFSQLVVTLAI